MRSLSCKKENLIAILWTVLYRSRLPINNSSNRTNILTYKSRWRVPRNSGRPFSFWEKPFRRHVRLDTQTGATYLLCLKIRAPYNRTLTKHRDAARRDGTGTRRSRPGARSSSNDRANRCLTPGAIASFSRLKYQLTELTDTSVSHTRLFLPLGFTPHLGRIDTYPVPTCAHPERRSSPLINPAAASWAEWMLSPLTWRRDGFGPSSSNRIQRQSWNPVLSY